MKPFLILALLVSSFAIPHSSLAARPNIVIILADDLGFGDVQCNNPDGAKIKTPHIDKLATQGMRFTDGHSSSAVCSPSRYALLTGRYHWRTRLQTRIVGVWDKQLIAPGRMTVATLAKQHGYRTAAIGKWHLGWDWPIEAGQRKLLQAADKKADETPVATQENQSVWREIFSQPIAGGPITHGFDSYFGTDVPNLPPYCFIENDRTVGIPSEFLSAENLVRENMAKLQGPAVAGWKLEPILPAITERAVKFIAESAAKAEPFLLYLPLTAPHTPLAVNAAWKDKSGLNAYADFVMETDAMVGRVLDALEKSGVADNTLVFLTSDNGCTPHAGVKDLEAKGHYPSGPLRGYKFEVYEGGHREPFIVRWPAVVKPGSVCGQLVHQADLLATFADILGTKLPDNAGEDSFSLLPLFRGRDQPVRENAVSCASSGLPGLRVGPWKLILGADPLQRKSSTTPDVQLYNLADDLGETKNLAAAQPERVAQMKTLMEKLITDGRSTPGAAQKNDTAVRRFPQEATPRKAGKETPKKTAAAPPKTDAPDDTALVSAPPGKKFVYKQSGGKPQEMEIYFPPGWDAKQSKVPGVLLFHGGSWRGGDLDQFRYTCQYLASRGLVAATANYRMLATDDVKLLPAGESNKRACVTDAKSAIRWMKQHAAELGIDPQRLIAGGGSAGGHVALLATTNPGLNDPGDPKEFDTSVVAYLLFNPALRMDKPDAEADALQHLKADLPPSIFFSGDRDHKWKPAADAVLQKLKTLGNKSAQLWIAEGKGHGFFNRPPWQDVTLAQTDRFLVKHGFLTGSGTLTPPQSGEKLVQAP